MTFRTEVKQGRESSVQQVHTNTGRSFDGDVNGAASELLHVGPTHGTIRDVQAVRTCLYIVRVLYPADRDEPEALARESKFRVCQNLIQGPSDVNLNPKVLILG